MIRSSLFSSSCFAPLLVLGGLVVAAAPFFATEAISGQFSENDPTRGVEVSLFDSSFEVGHPWAWSERQPAFIACGFSPIEINASKWFGGDSGTSGPRNVGTGQTYVAPCSFVLDAVRMTLTPFSTSPGLIEDLTLRVELRDSIGDVLVSTSTVPLVSSARSGELIPYREWIVVPLRWEIEEGNEYWMTWWIEEGLEDGRAFSSPGRRIVGETLGGLSSQVRLETDNLEEGSQWVDSTWQFEVEMISTTQVGAR